MRSSGERGATGQDRVRGPGDQGREQHRRVQADLALGAQHGQLQCGDPADRLLQDLPVRRIHRGGPPHLAVHLQGLLRVHPRGLPPELDQQQGQEGAQRHRRVVQLLQVRVRDLQGALPQDRDHAGRQGARHDHHRQAAEALPDAGDRERQGRHQEGEEPAHDILERGAVAEGGQRPPVRDASQRHLGVASACRDPVPE